MFSKSTGITLLILIVPSLAALGPPPGSRGVIDFRYPDYIVEPRPNCPSEGVFPHPRNCSWYYRCHDPYGVGYYHQNYFECEPGTVFSDALDQCIHPFNPDYPCETAKPPVPDCYDSMIRCKVYLCPNEQNVMLYIGRLCETAFSVCINGTQTNYCSSGLFFDVLTRTCVQPPGERNCVDEETFDSTATPPTSTTTTTTAVTTINPDDCYDSMVECREYQCPDSSGLEFLCKKAFRTCNYNQLTFYCASNNFFNHRTRQCVGTPSSRGCVQLQEPTTTTTTTETIDPSLLTFTFTVECSVEDPRPKDPQLAKYYCANYSACTRSGEISQVELCLKYLQCVREKDKWKAVLMECPPGLYFSYENDICTGKPDNTCLAG